MYFEIGMKSKGLPEANNLQALFTHYPGFMQSRNVRFYKAREGPWGTDWRVAHTSPAAAAEKPGQGFRLEL